MTFTYRRIIQNITANTTLGIEAADYIIFCNNGVTLTLPTLVNNTCTYLIRNAQTANNFNFTLAVQATGTEKILWADTTAVTSQTLRSSVTINNGGCAMFMSNGTYWYPLIGAAYAQAIG